MKENIEKVIAERKRQNEKWGVQNHPSIDGFAWLNEDLPDHYGILSKEDAKTQCDHRFKNNQGTWVDILLEEVSDVIHAPTPELMKEELIQVLAVGFSWLESIDRNEIENNCEHEHIIGGDSCFECADCGTKYH